MLLSLIGWIGSVFGTAGATPAPSMDPAWASTPPAIFGASEAGRDVASAAAASSSGPIHAIEPPPATPRTKAIGATGTAIVNGQIAYEEWNRDLTNEKWLGSYGKEGVADKMRRTDPQIRRSMQLLKLPLLAAKWIFEPANDTPEAKEHADLCSYVFFELWNWANELRHVCMMFDYGVSLSEAVDETINVPRERFPHLKVVKLDGQTSMATGVRLEPRLPRTIHRWQEDPEHQTRVKFVEQFVGFSDRGGPMFRTIPGDRLVRATHDQEGSNFQGFAALRPSYKPWVQLDHYEKLTAIKHERRGAGVAKITLPPNPTEEDRTLAQEIGAGVRSHEKGFVVCTHEMDFTFVTTGEGEGTDIESAIMRCIRAIADNVLAGFMALGSDGATGSYALADTQADQYLNTITAAAAFIEQVFNQGLDGFSVVRRIIDLNYGPQAFYPKLKATQLKSRDDYAQILPLVVQLLTSKGITSNKKLERQILERLNFEPLSEAEEAEAEEARKKEREKKAAPPPGNAPPTSDGQPDRKVADKKRLARAVTMAVLAALEVEETEEVAA